MSREFRIILIIYWAFTVDIFNAQAQIKYDTSKTISGIVYLDSIVVVASRQGFDVEDFISLVMTDTTFYQAFKNLRFLNYDFNNRLKATYFQSREIGIYRSDCHQTYADHCRSMSCQDVEFTNGYYKRGFPVYFTSNLYERLFLTKGVVCNQPKKSAQIDSGKRKKSRPLANPVEEIKVILFKPGQRSRLPIIGRKMDIFSPKMSKYYDFSITSSDYNGLPCYVFSAMVRPKYKLTKVNKTVVKNLQTYFHKEDFQILYRDYKLKYSSSLIDFDIEMKIDLSQINNLYYPTRIRFNGYWDVPTKKAEQSTFELTIMNPAQ